MTIVAVKIPETVTIATCLGSLGVATTNRNNNICYFDAQGAKVCTSLATVVYDNTISKND